MNLPLMNLHERVLSVLGCRHVDDVLIDAPYEITDDMLGSLNIGEVVHVTNDDYNGDGSRFQVARERRVLHEMISPCEFNVGNIIQRIQRNQETFQARFEKKMAAENSFYKEKREINGSKES